MDLNLFKTDEKKSDEGVWCPVDAVTEIKIARYGNRVFQRALKNAMKPYKQLIDRGAIDDDTADRVLVTAIADGILLDWRGMTRNGKELPYSREEAVKILLDKSLRDFRALVVELSQDMQMFRDAEIEEAAGNLQSSSDGIANGESVSNSLEA